MTEENILNSLTGVLREIFGDDSLVATRELAAKDVQDWDSLANIRLFLEVERVYAMRFTATEMAGLRNVGELVDLISLRSGGTSAPRSA